MARREQKEAADAQERSPLRDGPLSKPSEIREVLREAAHRRLPILLMEPDAQVFMRGNVESASRELLTVALPRGSNEKAFRPLGCCGATFNSARGSFFFLQSVAAVYEENVRLGSPKIVLHVPEQLGWVQRRFSFRVPVFPSSGLEVVMTLEGDKPVSPMPIDVSMSGILVEFRASDDPDLALEHELPVTVRRGNDVAALRGIVRRRMGHRYGLYFPECVTVEGIQPTEELRRIVKSLEGDWLRARAER